MTKLNREQVEEAVKAGHSLANQDLSGLDFECANLEGADLSNANLSRANLKHANLKFADLSHANLSHANLSHAGLSGANLGSANLNSANLFSCDAKFSDFRQATFKYSNLEGCDLRNTVGNMSEIKSAQIEQFSVVWYCDQNGKTKVCIGCQCKPLETFESLSSDSAIVRENDSYHRWHVLSPIIFDLIKTSPPIPWC